MLRNLKSGAASGRRQVKAGEPEGPVAVPILAEESEDGLRVVDGHGRALALQSMGMAANLEEMVEKGMVKIQNPRRV